MTTINEGQALYLGGETVDRVYLGADQVWPSWTPDMLPGLAAWIDPAQDVATYTDNQKVGTYISHDPAGLVFTADAGEEPTFKIIAGMPRLDFNYGALEAVTNLGTEGFTWVIVTRHANAWTGPSGYEMLISYNSSTGDGMDYELRHPGNFGIQLILEYNLNFLAPMVGFGGQPDIDYLFMVTADQATQDARLYVDNTEIIFTDVAPQSLPTAATDLNIGKRQGWALYKGLVSEALAFRGVLSAADRAKLTEYLTKKWGL